MDEEINDSASIDGKISKLVKSVGKIWIWFYIVFGTFWLVIFLIATASAARSELYWKDVQGTVENQPTCQPCKEFQCSGTEISGRKLVTFCENVQVKYIGEGQQDGVNTSWEVSAPVEAPLSQGQTVSICYDPKNETQTRKLHPCTRMKDRLISVFICACICLIILCFIRWLYNYRNNDVLSSAGGVLGLADIIHYVFEK